MARKQGKGAADWAVESLFDLNESNVWSVEGFQIAELWRRENTKEGFAVREAKLLNIMRTAFELVHYDPEDERAKQKYENGEWTTFTSVGGKNGEIAIRRKRIERLSDLGRENVKRITAATVLELIDRNFGGGWDSVPSATKEIIESCFDVSVTQLPASRLHAAGGTLERKVGNGFEVLEIKKGTWTEAIFVRKKVPVVFAAEEEVGKNKEEEKKDTMLPDYSESVAEEAIADPGDNGAAVPGEEYGDDEGLYTDYMDEADIGEGDGAGDAFIIEEEE